jgi:hypothetical protein
VYQVSGFFQDLSWGPVVVARLIRFIEGKYDVRAKFIYDGDDPYDLQGWYRSVERWSELFRISGRISRLAAEIAGPAGVKGRSEARAVLVHGTLMRVVGRLKETMDLLD